MLTQFPNAKKIGIAVFATTNAGFVLDCENGDATPTDCPKWIRMRQAAGLAVPTIYCNLSTYPAVRAACAGLSWNWWAAHPNGVPHMEFGAVATQFAWPSIGSPGHYDISLVDSGWLQSLGV